VFVAVAPPGVEFFNKGLFVRDAAIETLGRKDTQFGFRHIKPIAVLRRVMPFETSAFNKIRAFRRRYRRSSTAQHIFLR
jgi:hypothetical protein